TVPSASTWHGCASDAAGKWAAAAAKSQARGRRSRGEYTSTSWCEDEGTSLQARTSGGFRQPEPPTWRPAGCAVVQRVAVAGPARHGYNCAPDDDGNVTRSEEH